jgi:gamma-carbonic anhydrase
MLISMSQADGPILKPKVGRDCFIAPGAVVVGDVELGDQSSVWFNTTVRGDVMPVRIGAQCNVQDNSVLHGTYKKCGLTLERRVSVGHGVILHGCHIHENTLIGMGSILMDNVVIGAETLIGAGTLITENSEFPPGVLIVGRPGVVKRELRPEEREFLRGYADRYLGYKGWYDKMEVIE